ncbi:MAG: YbaB/EbfC family nucleoid-associated protein [Candidatus Binatia bacterium]
MSKPEGLGGMGDLLRHAQELQSKLARLQEEAEQKTVESSAGGGMVTAVVNGKLQVVSIRIDPSVIESGDRDMIQDLVVAAVNEGIRKAQQLIAEEMSRATGGLRIPGFTG